MSLEDFGYSELDTSEYINSNLRLHKFDPNVEEVWLMQCAKSLNIHQLENQKIKLPGRTRLNDLECVSLENADDKEHYESFGWCNRKGKMSVCRLPIKGTILVRKRLTVPQNGVEELEERCPLAIIAAPHEKTRKRHPLLGHNFEKALDIHPKIKHRLKKLQKQSQSDATELAKRKKILSVERSKGMKRSSTNQLLNGDISSLVGMTSSKKMKKTKADTSNNESDDLAWIKNI